LKVITSRQIRFLGHVLRKNELEAIALTGKIEGKWARGRQRKMFLNWVSFACGNRWTGVEILKLCQRREEHQLIGNVRFWYGSIQQDRTASRERRTSIHRHVTTLVQHRWLPVCRLPLPVRSCPLDGVDENEWTRMQMFNVQSKTDRKSVLVYCTNQTKKLMEKLKGKPVSSPEFVKAVRWKGWGLWWCKRWRHCWHVAPLSARSPDSAVCRTTSLVAFVGSEMTTYYVSNMTLNSGHSLMSVNVRSPEWPDHWCNATQDLNQAS